MKEKKNIPFGKIFVLVFMVLLSVKFIFDFDGFWRLFSAIGGAVISVLSYVLVGFIIAYILDTYVQFLANKVMKKWIKHPRTKRWLCIILGYATFAGVLAFFVFTLVPSLIDSLKMLLKEVPDLVDQFTKLYGKLLDGTLINLPESAIASIDKTVKGFAAGLLEMIDVSKISNFLTTATVTVFNAVMGIMVSVYMLCEKESIMRAGNKILHSLFNSKTARRIKWAGYKVNEIFKCYFTGKILQACIMSLMAFVAFTLLKLPYAMLFAVVIGVLNMIPYIGPWVGAVPVVLICLVDGFWTGVAATAGIIVVQVIDNWIISPRIIGNQMGISPLAILIGLCIGGKIFGIAGMIMGDVMAALIKVFFYDTYIEAIRRKKLREKAAREREKALIAAQAGNANAVTGASEGATAPAGTATATVTTDEHGQPVTNITITPVAQTPQAIPSNITVSYNTMTDSVIAASVASAFGIAAANAEDEDVDPDEDLFGGVPHDAIAEESAKERALLEEERLSHISPIKKMGMKK